MYTGMLLSTEHTLNADVCIQPFKHSTIQPSKRLSLSVSMTSFTMLPLLLMVAMMLLGRGSTKKVLSLQAMHGEYGSLNNDADSLSPAAGTGPNGGIRAAQTRPAKFQHDLYLNLKGDLWPVSKSPLATENLLEDTWWVASSPLFYGRGAKQPIRALSMRSPAALCFC